MHAYDELKGRRNHVRTGVGPVWSDKKKNLNIVSNGAEDGGFRIDRADFEFAATEEHLDNGQSNEKRMGWTGDFMHHHALSSKQQALRLRTCQGALGLLVGFSRHTAAP